MAKPKRLLSIDALEWGNALLDKGVPMTKVHEQLDLDWNYQSTRDVFIADRKKKFNATRPPWLLDKPNLQTPPEEWFFDGIFPNGNWQKRSI